MNLREYIAALQAIADANPATLEIPVCIPVYAGDSLGTPCVCELEHAPRINNGEYSGGTRAVRYHSARGAYVGLWHT